MTIETIVYGLILAVVFCLYILLRVLKEGQRLSQLEEWQAYRKRAMNGLIFDDRWEPEATIKKQRPAGSFAAPSGPKPARMNLLEYKEQPIKLVREDNNGDADMPYINKSPIKVQVFNLRGN